VVLKVSKGGTVSNQLTEKNGSSPANRSKRNSWEATETFTGLGRKDREKNGKGGGVSATL